MTTDQQQFENYVKTTEEVINFFKDSCRPFKTIYSDKKDFSVTMSSTEWKALQKEYFVELSHEKKEGSFWIQDMDEIFEILVTISRQDFERFKKVPQSSIAISTNYCDISLYSWKELDILQKFIQSSIVPNSSDGGGDLNNFSVQEEKVTMDLLCLCRTNSEGRIPIGLLKHHRFGITLDADLLQDDFSFTIVGNKSEEIKAASVNENGKGEAIFIDFCGGKDNEIFENGKDVVVSNNPFRLETIIIVPHNVEDMLHVNTITISLHQYDGKIEKTMTVNAIDIFSTKLKGWCLVCADSPEYLYEPSKDIVVSFNFQPSSETQSIQADVYQLGINSMRFIDGCLFLSRD